MLPSVETTPYTCDTLSNLITNKSAIFSEDSSNLVLNFLNGTHTGSKGSTIAMYSFPIANTSIGSVNVTITSCRIESGEGWPETYAVTCKDRQENPSSQDTFRAKVLAIILAQDNYQVNFHVYKTVFKDYVHDSSYSAVVVHDYSAVTNNVEFQDCDFDVTSTVGLLFSIIDDEKIKMNRSESYYTVRKCSFGEREPMQELINICVKATDSHAHFQKIIVTECKFTKSLGSTWIIRIFYCINHDYVSRGYPSTAIEIDRCVFAVRFPIKFNLRQESWDFFLKHNYLPAGNFPKILMIKHTLFEQAIVEINGPQYSMIEWRYMEVDRISLSETEFLNCSITVDSQIKVVKSHVMLTNCHLFNSTLTPVIAENSEIAVQGQNLFEQNRGECGGAIKLKNSTLLLLPNSETIISRNVADFGGDIYVKQPEYSFYRFVEVLKKYCTIIINSII